LHVWALKDPEARIARHPFAVTHLDLPVFKPRADHLSEQVLPVEVEDARVVDPGADLDVEVHGATLCSARMETPPDAVVFDNDGLLLDTESVWTRAEQDLFERRGLRFTPADKRELVGTSAAAAGRVLERRLRAPGRAEELIDELNELVVAELEHGV